MKANINNQVLEIEVINSNYNNHASEVKILEGTFTGKKAIVENTDLTIDKYTVSAKCSMYQSEDSYERTLFNSDYSRSLQFELTITSENEDTQNYIFDKIANYMQSEIKECNFQFAGCPTIESGQYWDCASIDFEHGSMTEIKKAIMATYKEAKKSLK